MSHYKLRPKYFLQHYHANILPGVGGTFTWQNLGPQLLPSTPTYSYDVALKLYRCP
jgi:hypothetical protein